MGLWESAKNFANKATGGGVSSLFPTSFSGDNVMSFIPGIGDAMAAEKQNAANIAAAREAMAFSERMSSTAYQRAMADMRKAGLNPTLAYMQGGASAPSGVQPTIASESKTKLGEAAISTALGVKGLSTQQQQADTQQQQAQSTVTLNNASAAKQVADTAKTQAETENIKKDSKKKGVEADIYDEAGKTVRTLLDNLGSSAKGSKSTLDKVDKLFGSGVKGLQRLFKGDPRVKPAKQRLLDPSPNMRDKRNMNQLRNEVYKRMKR